MNENDGIYSVQVMNIDELCVNAERFTEKPDRIFEFAIRWQDGEIADDLLCVETDGYYDENEKLYFGKQTYELEFAGDTLIDVVKAWMGMPDNARPAASTALRYYIEFDAWLDNGVIRTGGKWAWGNGDNRPKKREPQEFYEQWRYS